MCIQIDSLGVLSPYPFDLRVCGCLTSMYNCVYGLSLRSTVCIALGFHVWCCDSPLRSPFSKPLLMSFYFETIHFGRDHPSLSGQCLLHFEQIHRIKINKLIVIRWYSG